MPDYARFLQDVLGDATRGPAHSELVTAVASELVDVPTLIKRSGGDPGNVNGVVDAQLDRLIAGSDGDIRLALFSAIAAPGSALTVLLGPRPGGPA